jgi:hypothetical protein
MAEEPKQPGHKPEEDPDDDAYKDLEPDPDDAARIVGGDGAKTGATKSTHAVK